MTVPAGLKLIVIAQNKSKGYPKPDNLYNFCKPNESELCLFKQMCVNVQQVFNSYLKNGPAIASTSALVSVSSKASETALSDFPANPFRLTPP